MSVVLNRSSELPVSAEQAFAWHERAGALARLTPPWQQVREIERQGTIRDGERVILEVRIGPVWKRFVAEHRDYDPPRGFADEQISGPFRRWRHERRFVALGPERCRIEEHIECEPPLGALMGGLIRRRLNLLFNHRHRLLRDELAMHGRYGDRPRMSIAVSGASGLVGRALCAALSGGGHRVLRLVRKSEGSGAEEIAWDPQRAVLEPRKLEGVDAVIHLAGESVAGLWTDSRMQAIRNSRVVGTRVLGEALAKLERRPRSLVCASAVGYYGDGGSEVLDETAASGEGFLAEVARQWEQAAEVAREAGIRVAHLRLGVVLSPKGGALRAMLPAFRLGVAGPLGSGRQYMSWLSLDDAVGAFHHVLMNEQIVGPVNVATEEAVTNRQFTRTLGRVLRRPTVMRVPAAVLRWTLGQMAEEMLLSSVRVKPRVLMESGYVYRDAVLETALRSMLGRPSRARRRRRDMAAVAAGAESEGRA